MLFSYFCSRKSDIMIPTEQQKAARHFAETWQGKGYEKGESQSFWISLLNEVLGIKHPTEYISFEQQVKLDHTAFIDAYIPKTHVMIEQKSIEKDLGAPVKQSDGHYLTPFQQAKRYASELPYSQRPRWIVTCNFREFWIYDMEQPNSEPQKILLENLEKEYYRLQFLVDEGNEHLKREMEVSVKAGELVGIIYDKLIEQYIDKNSPETLRSLNILCVRLVFCLYAEDAGLFATRTAFHDYLLKYGASDFRRALMDLFVLLDTPLCDRDPYLEEDIAAFPYVNGGLFSEEKIIIPRFTDELRQLILQQASANFDWSEISPTIFGAVFESTLNPETRRSGGMHYTSIENIHKVIDPLFLNDLHSELDEILQEKVEKKRLHLLDEYQDKLASLTFLDPACGSGNFLTETYLSLRRLENKVISERYHNQMMMGEFMNPVKVSIHQFYGIEINDFAVTVATTALWISEAQMLNETERIIQHDIDFLPLKNYSNIKEGNALRTSWTEWEISEQNPVIIAKKTHVYPTVSAPITMSGEAPARYGSIDLYSDELTIHTAPPKPTTYHVDFDYIMGNPPFIGHQHRTEDQVKDMDLVFEGFDTYGKLDYVAAWYKKAADIMQNTSIKAAFVSTNSICQGESVAVMWKPLMEKRNLTITFAYQTFKWISESNGMAAVHCVIIGFKCEKVSTKRLLFINEHTALSVDNINGYLISAPNVFVQGRCEMLTKGLPIMTKGSQPTDGGNLFFTPEERLELLQKYPQAEPLIKRFVGADEFINNKERYCLWLKGVSPHEYVHIPPIMERLQKVREMRQASPTASVRRDADTPMLFTQIRQPDSDYLIIPSHTGENRRYIPIGYMSKDIICGNANQMLPDVSLYMFGILTSNVHMAWMRVVCGRLKSDYRYSPAVYNSFPWPTPTDQQKAKIERAAQMILDARAMFPECSLAELYNENGMSPELRKAHQENDCAVMQAYGFDVKMAESECVAELFKLYKEMIAQS